MKKLILLLLFIPLISFSQALEKHQIQSVVETFFKGFHEKDSTVINSVLNNSFNLNSISYKENNAVLKSYIGDTFISAVISRNDNPVWTEKLMSFEIKIDGPLANAWVEYEFWLDGKLSQIKFGEGSFTSIHLIKEKNGWKIFNITDSRRFNCQS